MSIVIKGATRDSTRIRDHPLNTVSLGFHTSCYKILVESQNFRMCVCFIRHFYLRVGFLWCRVHGFAL